MKCPRFSACRRREPGFTLVELITVLILLGILSVAVMPRFFDNTFSERGFHDGAVAAVQHARRVAVASRRFVCVTIAPGTGAAGVVSINIDTREPETISGNVACATPVPLPSRSDCAPNQLCAPKGVTLGPAAGMVVIFDPLGRSVTMAKAVAKTLAISISGQPDIAIETETGWIH